jgi:hypothetical protein
VPPLSRATERLSPSAVEWVRTIPRPAQLHDLLELREGDRFAEQALGGLLAGNARSGLRVRRFADLSGGQSPTLRDAIEQNGFMVTYNTFVGAVIMDAFCAHGGQHVYRAHWEHVLRISMLATSVARVRESYVGRAFAAGMLWDAGRLLASMRGGTGSGLGEPPDVLKNSVIARPLVDALLEHWALPEDISVAVREGREPASGLAQLVADVADVVAAGDDPPPGEIRDILDAEGGPRSLCGKAVDFVAVALDTSPY